MSLQDFRLRSSGAFFLGYPGVEDCAPDPARGSGKPAQTHTGEDGEDIKVTIRTIIEGTG